LNITMENGITKAWATGSWKRMTTVN